MNWPTDDAIIANRISDSKQADGSSDQRDYYVASEAALITQSSVRLQRILLTINGQIGSASSFGTFVDLVVASMLFVSGLFTARVLGSDGRGELAAGIAFVSLAFIAGNMGLHTSNSFYAARGEISDSVLLGNSLAGAAIFSTLTAGILFALAAFTPAIKGSAPGTVIAAGCLFLPLMFLDIYLTYILLGKQRFVETGALSLVSRAISFVFVILACLWLPSVLLVFLATMMVVPARLALMIVFFRRTPIFVRPALNWSDFRRSMKYAIRARGSDVFQFLNLRLDIFILNYMTNATGLGVYTLAVFISEFSWYPVNGLTRVIYPRIAERSGASPAETAQQALLWSRLALTVTVVLALGVTAAGFVLIVPLFGSDFAGARLVMLLLLPGTATYSVSRILTDSLAGLGYPHLGSFVALSSLVVTLVLDLMLIPRYGINGAAVASSVAYTSSAVVASLIFARRMNTGLFEPFKIRQVELAELVSFVLRTLTLGRNALRWPSADI